MPSQDGRLSLVELVFIIAVFICQQFEDLFLRLHLHAEHALQLVLHHLGHVNQTSQEIHLSRSRMVPQQCTDTDVTTPLFDRLMWQEHADVLRRTHLQMLQIPRIPLQQQQGCSGFRQLHNLVSAQEMATQTSPDQFGTVAEAPAEVTYPKAVTSGTAPAEESPAPAVVSPNAVSSQTVAAPAAAAATTAAGIAEVPSGQASSTMTQGDSGYSSSGRQDRGGDGAVSREPLPFRPGDTNSAAPKNGSDRNHTSSGDGTTANNSDDEGRDDEEHG